MHIDEFTNLARRTRLSERAITAARLALVDRLIYVSAGIAAGYRPNVAAQKAFRAAKRIRLERDRLAQQNAAPVLCSRCASEISQWPRCGDERSIPADER